VQEPNAARRLQHRERRSSVDDLRAHLARHMESAP
jgi:hypothetical protein